MKKIALAGLFMLIILLAGCSRIHRETLSIVSGSENETLEPIIEKFERKSGIKVEMHYKGSVDIMLELEDGEIPYDAVWPANSMWISLGDKERKIKNTKSIMTSPVVFGIRTSVAEELGFTDGPVYVRDIVEAIRENQFKFMMTSATQSNSGASAYFGFLYALAGNPEVLTQENLNDAELQNQAREILSAVNRSSGSSGWLKDLFLASNYDAMVNYEAIIIETNIELIRNNREPLTIIYPVDGIVIADSPLGYVNKGNDSKENAFLKLQEYLLSPEVQSQLSDLGRRTGMGALAGELNPEVFRKEWGINTETILSPFRMPSAEVIREALTMYQIGLKKPSFTVFCLDYSGSMVGSGEKNMKQAMRLVLDQTLAEQYMLQSGAGDVTLVIPFNDRILDYWSVEGNNADKLNTLYKSVKGYNPGGGTDIYNPVINALRIMKKVENLDEYQPAIILLTDGVSQNIYGLSNLRAEYGELDLDVPVFGILFGQADRSQLEEITELTSGRIFDGKDDLVGTFRKAKGYN